MVDDPKFYNKLFNVSKSNQNVDFFENLTFYQVEDYCIFLISEKKKSTPFSSKLRNTLIAIFFFINHQCKLKNNDKNHVKSYHSKKTH